MDKIWIMMIIIGIILLITLVITIISITEISKIYSIASTNKTPIYNYFYYKDYASTGIIYVNSTEKPLNVVSLIVEKQGTWLLSGSVVYGGKKLENVNDGNYFQCYYSVDDIPIKLPSYGIGGPILKDNWGTVNLPNYIIQTSRPNTNVQIFAQSGSGENAILYASIAAIYLPQ